MVNELLYGVLDSVKLIVCHLFIFLSNINPKRSPLFTNSSFSSRDMFAGNGSLPPGGMVAVFFSLTILCDVLVLLLLLCLMLLDSRPK